MRPSPVYSANDRMACSIGMCGHRSTWPLRAVRSGAGPKNPSGACVDSTASIHRVPVDSTRESPVT